MKGLGLSHCACGGLLISGACVKCRRRYWPEPTDDRNSGKSSRGYGRAAFWGLAGYALVDSGALDFALDAIRGLAQE